MASPKELKLCSPVGAEAIMYRWPLCKSKSYNGAAEIVETIRLVCNDYPELSEVMEKMVLQGVDYNSYDSMKTLCDKFNKAVTAYKNLWKGTAKFPQTTGATRSHLRHILQQVYNRSVTEPEKLNIYEPFTPAVYGETSFDLIFKMIEIIKPTEDDVFMDLGSGVGQVVVQMAGGSQCRKCLGIEKEELPTTYARTLEIEFRKWMKWYGKSYQDFELLRGDFLDSQFHELIMSATVVFVNNFAFGPEVDHKLKQIFAEMNDGTKIVSSKAFCPLNFRISDRNLSDIGTIMNVSELSSQTGSVSWTDKPVTYYLHVIDRKKLEHYFASAKNGSSKPELKRSGSKSSWSSRDSNSSHGGVESSMSHPSAPRVEEEAYMVVGTTTRRQYASWLAQKEKQRKEIQPSRVSKTANTSMSSVIESVAYGSPAASETAEDEQENEHEADEEEDEEDEGEQEEYESERKSSRQGVRRPGRPRKSQVTLKAQQAKKKYQKQRRPGRPPLGNRKIPKRKSTEWMGALEFMHQQIVSASTCSGNERNALMNVQDLPHVKETAAREKMGAGSTLATCAASLDIFMAQQRKNMEEFLSFMGTQQYRASIFQSIEKENARQRQLRERSEQLERQILRLQEDGVQLLRARMSEVGITAETPAELLNKAKEIVMSHQALQTRANNLDCELRTLEVQNECLVALCKERDEQAIRNGILQTMGFSERLSADDAKTAILREIGLSFNRRRALLVETARIETEIQSLETNNPNNISTDFSSPTPVASDKVPPAVPISPPSAVAEAIHSGVVAAENKRANSARRKAASGNRGASGKGKQTTAAAATTPSNPPTTVALTATTSSSDTNAPEDIEEKIRDIVRKALSVDNAAKRAEKERKARTAERKRTTKPVEKPAGKQASPGKQKSKNAPKNVQREKPIFEDISPTKSTEENIFATIMDTEQRPASRSSSATESAPSDHEDFLQEEKTEQGKTGEPGTLKTLQKEKEAFQEMHQRPSSVPTFQASASHFSISNLIRGRGATNQEAYPRVSSAFARLDAEGSTVGSEAPVSDSGFHEGSSESSKISRLSKSSTTTSIPYRNKFKGSANVGQPGSPHSLSNPGNPTTEKEESYSNPYKGVSNTGNAGNPHDFSNPGNPSTTPDETNDVTEPKPLQPFRIPRRTTVKELADSPDTRSPLAHVACMKKEEVALGWMASTTTGGPAKKRRKLPDMSPAKKRFAPADTTAFDQIMNNMMMPRQPAPAKKPASVHSDSSSETGRKKDFIPAPSKPAQSMLTREILEKHAASSEAYSFAEKGLMEALLEHKMITGRIESHSQIARKLRLSATALIRPPSPQAQSPKDGPSAANLAARRGPKTPEYTPPSSPTGSAPSHTSKRSNYSGVSNLEGDSFNAQLTQNPPPSSSAPAPAAAPNAETKSPSTTKTLEMVARLTNIDLGQLSKCLSEEALRTLQEIDPTLLVATLSTLLSTVAKSVNRPATTAGNEVAAATSTPCNASKSFLDKSEELVTSTSMVEDKTQQQPVEMEIDSSSGDGESPRPAKEKKTETTPNSEFVPNSEFLWPNLADGNNAFFSGPLQFFDPQAAFGQFSAEQLQNMFLLMQNSAPFATKEPEFECNPKYLRNGTRFVKDYMHGLAEDPEYLANRPPSPEPKFIVPPPPRPIRIDYSYPIPRALSPAPLEEEEKRNESDSISPSASSSFPPFSMAHFPPPMPPIGFPRFGPIPSLLDLDSPFARSPPRPPRFPFPLRPPMFRLNARFMRGHREGGRPF